MTQERPQRRTRFAVEKKAPFRKKEGSYESVLVGIKDALPDEVFGVGDTEYWQPIEEKATMKLKDAVFQFYLEGTGHISLAAMIVRHNRNITAAVSLGMMTATEKLDIIGRIADRLYEEYPKNYRNRFNK